MSAKWVVSIVTKHWFLLGIVVVITAAHIAPHLGATHGPLMPEITVKYMAVSLIFFNSGLSLRTEELSHAFTQMTLHGYIQGFTLVLVPGLVWLLVQLLQNTSMDPWLLNGLLVVGAMPPPVSSAVILTKAIGGNEAAAIFNSAFGSFLGIIVTPMWLLQFLGSASSVAFSAIFGQLSLTVLFPLVMGQMFRSVAKHKLYRWNIPYGTISSATLLVIIYSTFCDTFMHAEIDIDELTLLSITCLIIALQCLLLTLTFRLSTHPSLRFSPQDVVAALFCSTHKSLTLGIPMLKIVFADDPQLSVLSVPLLVYHPTQILLGGLLVPTVRSWMHDAPRPMHRRSGFLKNV